MPKFHVGFVGHLLVTLALLAVCTFPCFAEPTTTGEVGDAADFLTNLASCKDFTEALGDVDNPRQNVADMLLVILGIAYMEGYTAGTGVGREGRAAFLLDCVSNPDRRLNTVAVRATEAEAEESLGQEILRCWNIGALSSDALKVKVVVGVTISETGLPEANTIRLIDFSGGSETSAGQAFEAARRAIIRCGASGFNGLPRKRTSLGATFDPAVLGIKTVLIP